MTKMDIGIGKDKITLPKMMYKLEKLSADDTLVQLQSIYSSSTIPRRVDNKTQHRGQDEENSLPDVEASVEPSPEPSSLPRVEASPEPSSSYRVKPLAEPSSSSGVETSVEPPVVQQTPFIKTMEERVKSRGYSFRGFLYAPPNDESLIRRVIGKRGYYLYLTTDKNQLDFLWYDKKTNQFLFWGDKPNVIRAMNIMRHRILTKMDSVC